MKKQTKMPRESAADMKAEVAAMKRGGASARLIAKEKAEHKAMAGMKSGGKIAAGRLSGRR